MGQLQAVSPKAVGRDLWAPDTVITWVSCCYFIKASVLEGPLSSQRYISTSLRKKTELNQIQTMWK